MPKCYLCRTEITEENKSVEHIVPNAIGGRLKSSKILCKDCNSKLGSSMDANLAKQLEFFANQLNVKRERGSAQNIEMKRKSTGDVYLVSPEGDLTLRKPLIEINKSKLGSGIRIRANNINELKKTLKGLKRKYPKLNEKEINNLVKDTEERIKEPLYGTLDFDMGKIYPAVLKMAINYYFDKFGGIDTIAFAIEDMKHDELNCVDCVFFEHPLVRTDSEEVFHCIYINGNEKEKKLYAFVELYSTLQFVVRLSDDYSGPTLQSLYVFDILKSKEIKRELNYRLSFDFVFSYNFQMTEYNLDLFKKKLNRILQIGAKRRFDCRLSRIMRESFKAAFGEPDGRNITKDDVVPLVDEMMKRITPYIG